LSAPEFDEGHQVNFSVVANSELTMNLRRPQGLLDPLLDAPTTEWNLSESDLIKSCLDFDNCRQASNGAIVAYSGKFSGRIPKDKFIVLDDETRDVVWWDANSSISQETFQGIRA
jgi:ATP-dependent phosphoenolpyruvate carboxykinase